MTMNANPSRGSVTNWISQVRHGRNSAANQLWARYENRLVALAARRISGTGIVVADEDDLANDALGAFLVNIRDGNYEGLSDREDLWKLLATITINKANTLVRDQYRDKRDARKTSQEDDETRPLGNVGVDPQPTPDVTVMLAESVGHCLSLIRNSNARDASELEEIALGRFEGRTNAEIARRIGKSVATVERRFANIRRLFMDALNEND